jgi:8-oxo-dGTP pyrophosphatase MutT (NUDIX family)
MSESIAVRESVELPRRILVAGTVLRDGTFLVVHNVKNGLRIEPSGGKWHGSAIETLEEAVMRELREELSINVRVLRKIGVYPTDMTKEGVFDVHTYLCEIVEGEPVASEPGKIEGFEWLTPDALEANPSITPSLRATLQDLRAIAAEAR